MMNLLCFFSSGKLTAVNTGTGYLASLKRRYTKKENIIILHIQPLVLSRLFCVLKLEQQTSLHKNNTAHKVTSGSVDMFFLCPTDTTKHQRGDRSETELQFPASPQRHTGELAGCEPPATGGGCTDTV